MMSPRRRLHLPRRVVRSRIARRCKTWREFVEPETELRRHPIPPEAPRIPRRRGARPSRTSRAPSTRRRRIFANTRSPVGCPNVSLIFLNRSRSKASTEIGAPSRAACSNIVRAPSIKARQFARPVNESVRAALRCLFSERSFNIVTNESADPERLNRRPRVERFAKKMPSTYLRNIRCRSTIRTPPKRGWPTATGGR